MLGRPAVVQMVPVALMAQPAPVNYAHMVALSQAAQGLVAPEFRTKFQALQRMETHCLNLAIAASVLFFPLGLITLGGVLPRVRAPTVVGVNGALFLLSMAGFLSLLVFGSLVNCHSGWCYSMRYLWLFIPIFVPALLISFDFGAVSPLK